MENKFNEKQTVPKTQKMSGGRFDYKQYDIHRITNSIESIIAGEEDKEFGCEAIEVSKEVKEKLEEALIILKAAFIYTHRIDWLLSGDDDEKAFFKRLVKDFSKERINLSNNRVNGKTIIQLSKNKHD